MAIQPDFGWASGADDVHLNFVGSGQVVPELELLLELVDAVDVVLPEPLVVELVLIEPVLPEVVPPDVVLLPVCERALESEPADVDADAPVDPVLAEPLFERAPASPPGAEPLPVLVVAGVEGSSLDVPQPTEVATRIERTRIDRTCMKPLADHAETIGIPAVVPRPADKPIVRKRAMPQ